MLCNWLNAVIKHNPVHELRATVTGFSIRMRLPIGVFHGIARHNRTVICLSCIASFLTVRVNLILPRRWT